MIDFLENITRLDLVRTLSFGDTVSFLVSLVSLVIASLALKRQFYAPAKLDIYQLTTETLGGSASGGGKGAVPRLELTCRFRIDNVGDAFATIHGIILTPQLPKKLEKIYVRTYTLPPYNPILGPGQVHEQAFNFALSSDLKDGAGLPIKELLEELRSIPVVLEVEATVEFRNGRGKNTAHKEQISINLKDAVLSRLSDFEKNNPLQD